MEISGIKCLKIFFYGSQASSLLVHEMIGSGIKVPVSGLEYYLSQSIGTSSTIYSSFDEILTQIASVTLKAQISMFKEIFFFSNQLSFILTGKGHIFRATS